MKMSNFSRMAFLHPIRVLLISLFLFGSGVSHAQQSAVRLTDQQVLAYVASNPDLIAGFGTDVSSARAHYENYGIREGRSISFNALQYIASYPDLITVFGLDTESALRQYIRNGRNQGRAPSFDGLEYIASNISLIGYLGTNTDEAARHYITTGFGAGLKTASFDPLRYIASYADLIVGFGRDVVAGIKHFINNGFSERRTVTFNPTQYLANYSDLRSAYAGNANAATTHYIAYGFTEGRTAVKPNSAPTVTVNTSPAQIANEITAYPINSTVPLLAVGSDVDGDSLTYAWTIQSKPANSTATLGSPTNSSSGLSPDKPGAYALQVTVSDGKLTSSAQVTIYAGTPISGTLSASTVLDKASSPYVQIDRIAIPAGASLTIPAGVQLFGNNNITQVQGTFLAIGTANEKVKLTKVYIQPVGSFSTPHNLKIVYTDVIGTLYPSSGSANGSFTIEDSKIDISNQIYIPTLTNDSSLQRNYFVAGGVNAFFIGQKNLTIKNNSFPVGPPNLNSFGIYGISIYTQDSQNNVYLGIIDFSRNTFRAPISGLTFQPIAIRSSGNGVLDARNNFWGTTDVSAIDRLISDNKDDLNNGSVVNYMPFLATSDPLTPLQ